VKAALKLLTYLSAVSGMLLFIRPRDSAVNTLLWIPKMLSGALSPILGIVAGLGALLGLSKKDWKLASVGVLGAGLALRFIGDIPNASDQFAAEFGPDWQERLPSSLQPAAPQNYRSRPASAPGFQQDLVIGEKTNSGHPLLADLWQPQPGNPRSGLGVIYAHGSGWRVGDKDMLTRPFFRRLAGQGHVVLDIAYSLWPEADIQTMVSEVNQAILWLKKNSARFQLNPERIVLMGGSAGAHLSLLAAYAPGQPEFQPAQASGDTSVRGVIAFYPPVDLHEMFSKPLGRSEAAPHPVDKVANAMINRIFELHSEPLRRKDNGGTELENYLVKMLSGTPHKIPEVYDLLSPIKHISSDCPPTLLIQGSDDVFDLAPPVRRFHQVLQEAGVPVIFVEYPHTEHGFDLVLPQISPVAQAAAMEVERFLALMV
jgi:acetyl esterase/lipase